jgi:hypothetical protein
MAMHLYNMIHENSLSSLVMSEYPKKANKVSIWILVLTDDEHLSGFDEGVECGVGDDLAAVGPAVDEVHLGEVERATRWQSILKIQRDVRVDKVGSWWWIRSHERWQEMW